MSDALNGRGYGRGDDKDPPAEIVPHRYSVCENSVVSNLGTAFFVSDNKEQVAIALCWTREACQLIVDALNYPPLPRIPE